MEEGCLRRLGLSDAAAGLDLSIEARWNQTIADWRFMLEHGEGYAFFDDGRLVASALLLPCGGEIAWIGMVLVTARWRRRGLAASLVRRCLETCAERGWQPWLDATPAGAEVYAKLGFKPVRRLTRWWAAAPAIEAGAPLEPPGLELAADFDRAAMGCERRALLAHLLARAGGRAGMTGEGAVLARDGRNASQIGPLIAENEAAARALLRYALAPGGPAILDVFDDEPTFAAELGRLGFVPARTFLRMALGPVVPRPASPLRLFAVAGPELG